MEVGELIFIGFCSLAAINALFFIGYLIIKKNKNNVASITLSVFLVITVYRILQMLLHDLQDDFNIGINLKSFFFFTPTFLLIGPLLFIYLKSISIKDFKFKITHLYHFLPFVFFLFFDLLNKHNFPLIPDNKKYYIIYCIQISIFLIHLFVYLKFSFEYIKELILKYKSDSFPKENLNPYYIRNIALFISIIWIIYLIYCFQTYFKIYLPTRVLEAIYYSFLIYLILFYELHDQKITFISNFYVRYRNSGISKEDSLNYKSIILEHIQKNELFIDHNITLGKCAKEISLTTHLVSQIINEQLGCNFNDFINSYRIEKAKKMLKDPEKNNYTVASIAYDCGFNTLSAFNTAFKKFTRITPSQFRSIAE